MNLDYLKQNKELARRALLGISLVLAALTVLRVWQYQTASARARTIVANAANKSIADPEAVKGNLMKFTETANAIKKENMFVPPVPKQHPVSAVAGIMGNEALINEKWYKVGDKISDAEVVAIEPTLVRIKWYGEEKTFAPISAIVAETSAIASQAVHAVEAKEKKEKPKKSELKVNKMKAVKVASAKDDPLAWMGVELPSHLRKKIMKLWDRASEEDKRRGMAEWNNASDEKRREMLAELEAMPDEAMGG